MAKGKSSGLDWLVSARGYAMYVIFFGHVMLSYYTLGYTAVLEMGRFIQVGVIPFFIVLSGAFYQKPSQGFVAFFWLKFSQRILPVYFYALLVIPFILFFAKGTFFQEVLRWLPLYLLGIPMLSWPCWFLIALFSAELFYFFIAPRLKGQRQLWVGVVIFYLLAWGLNTGKLLLPRWVEVVSLFWMLQAVPLFLMFLCMGAALKKFILKLTRWSKLKVFALAVVSYLLVLPGVLLNTEFPSNKNQGLKHYITDDMPIMFIGQYGDIVWFFMGSVFGVFGFIALCRLLPVTRLMRMVGDHSMLLLGLNAIFHQVLNLQLAKRLPLPEDTWYWGLIYALLIGLVELLLSLAVAQQLIKYLPQLTGKPMLSGPILPALYRKKV